MYSRGQPTFLILIVIYGCLPSQSSSVVSLLESTFPKNRFRVLLWDNSPDSLKGVLPDKNFTYKSTPENISLSKIYNHVISEILLPDEYLLLLDQDTVLPNNFLAIADGAIKQHPDIDLFLPMIRANHNWVSPLNYYLGWGFYWLKPRLGRMKSSHICAINSGMIISARYLKDGERRIYDERLRFYGTDTQFMLDYSDRRNDLVVLDVHLEHDLSFFSDTVEERARKFSIMRSGYGYIYERHSIVHRFCVVSVMTVIALVYTLRYRSFSFFRQKI